MSLPDMCALAVRPASRLEAVLGAGQQASPTGAVDFAAVHRRAAANRAKAGAGLDAGADDLLKKKTAVLNQEAQEQAKRAQELEDQYKARQLAVKNERAATQKRIDDALDQEAERRAIQKELDAARREYRNLMRPVDDADDAIAAAGYEDNMVTAYNSIKLLSPTEAKTFMQKLHTINKAMSGVQAIKNLPKLDKLQASDRIDDNKEKIGKLTAYIPEIEAALDAELGNGRKSAAEQTVEQEARIAALRKEHKAKEAALAEQLQAKAKAIEKERAYAEEREKALEMRTKEIEYRLAVAREEASMREDTEKEKSASSMAALQKRLREMEDEMAKVKAKADIAEQAAEKCDAMLAKDAQDNAVAEETYRSLQMEVAKKKAVHEMNKQQADKAAKVLEGLEGLLEEARANAKSVYADYADWENNKDCSFRSCKRDRYAYHQKVVAALRAVTELTKKVDAERSERNAFFEDFLRSYTEQEVAVAVMQAAKQNAGKAKGPVNVVVGKPV